MDTAMYSCLGDVQSPIGIAHTFDQWKATGETVPRGQFFRQQVQEQINLLAIKLAVSLTNVPVVLSGMASSSIGIEQIPYSPLPFAIDGSQAGIRHSGPQPGFPHELFLISGVSSQDDVMRGEETQLIGLINLLTTSGHSLADAIYIFPGTHAKHLRVQNQHMTQFRTYMTGELFDLMAKRSILKDSIDLEAFSAFSEKSGQAFRQGVKQATSSALLNSLFSVRTNQLFDKLTKAENAFYLSGLLIGSELNYLLDNDTESVVLCGGSNLSPFYQLAMDELTLTDRTLTIPSEVMDRAASVGQICLFKQQTAKQPAQ